MAEGKNILKSSEELWAKAKAADVRIIFKTEQIPATSQRMEKLKMFLENVKPSQVKRSSGVGWISVTNVGHQSREEPRDPEAAFHEWNSWTGIKNHKTVNMIASKHNVTVGKWMVHVSTDLIDLYWERLVMAMCRGDLSHSVHSMKVSPFDDEADDGDARRHVICVYTPDYQDIDDVMKVENRMRSAGIAGWLTYKPDIFTYLGIYRNNEWNIRPTLYNSRMVIDWKHHHEWKQRSSIKIVETGRQGYNSEEGFQYSFMDKIELNKYQVLNVSLYIQDQEESGVADHWW